MWYHKGVGYGNDLVGCPVRLGDEGTMEAYAEFVRPLMPAHRQPEVQGKGTEEGEEARGDEEAECVWEEDDWGPSGAGQGENGPQ